MARLTLAPISESCRRARSVSPVSIAYAQASISLRNRLRRGGSGTFGSVLASLTLRLRLLVLPDGSVFDAKVEKSTGEAEIDQIAIGWIRGNWRYLPATVNGRPITAWTTVIVRFAAIHWMRAAGNL